MNRSSNVDLNLLNNFGYHVNKVSWFVRPVRQGEGNCFSRLKKANEKQHSHSQSTVKNNQQATTDSKQVLGKDDPFVIRKDDDKDLCMHVQFL